MQIQYLEPATAGRMVAYCGAIALRLTAVFVVLPL